MGQNNTVIDVETGEALAGGYSYELADACLESEDGSALAARWRYSPPGSRWELANAVVEPGRDSEYERRRVSIDGNVKLFAVVAAPGWHGSGERCSPSLVTASSNRAIGVAKSARQFRAIVAGVGRVDEWPAFAWLGHELDRIPSIGGAS